MTTNETLLRCMQAQLTRDQYALPDTLLSGRETREDTDYICRKVGEPAIPEEAMGGSA